MTNHQRPLVDFSGTSRETAREYARDLNSRVLKPHNSETLTRIAEGRKVDAYEVNAAVLDAMRSVTTRFGQSMQRREYAKRAAYLGHITQAVLEAAADDLPSYTDGGVRSRKIEEQARVIAGLTEDLAQHVALREYVEEYLLGADELASVAGFTHGYVAGTRD